MKPEFSIIIPTYNRVNTLGRAIESVLNQTYKGFELIVIDDGSEDFTVDFIRKFPKVLYRFQKNQGVGRARNLGSEIATKEWLVFLDSDDELTISALSNFEKQIELNPNFNLFVAGNERKTTVGSEVNIPKEGKYYPILSGTFCIRKEIFEKVRGAYALVGVIADKGLFAVRDSHGIRPLVLGKKGNSYMIASETVAFQVADYDFIRGLVVFVNNGFNVSVGEDVYSIALAIKRRQ